MGDRFHRGPLGAVLRPHLGDHAHRTTAQLKRVLGRTRHDSILSNDRVPTEPGTVHVFATAQGRAIDPTNLTRAFTTLLRKAGLRRIRFHDLRHSTATLLLEQGVELVVIKELLGHAHIGVTATVYAHVRLRLQRDAIDTLSTALDRPVNDESTRDDDGDPPPCGATVR
ncbi:MULTISPECIES: tyrosine-type recombinase/integrase [unclassified Streptomyces]|uniref:tyrosine-type recombinase/integrase n=1 Tax=unclassified Streptomyces TaxID=2593676 RepID=UPI001F1B8CC4|nr:MULTISPECIES: tyrosine-type recombinase/integrase [unclassified Streptomyces]